jgi:G3E family GTPase
VLRCRADLQETLRGLFADRARGAVPSFERVVIETSRLADPDPVLQTFATDRGLGRELHLGTLNAAPVRVAVGGEIEPSSLLDEPASPRLGADLGEAEHTRGLSSFALFFEEPPSWAAFEQTLAVLTALRGPDQGHIPVKRWPRYERHLAPLLKLR